MSNKVIAAFVSFVLAFGLCPAAALADDGSLVAAQSAGVSRVTVQSTTSTQAKKPSNAVKKKMRAAYLKVLRQARSGSVSCGGKGFGNSYAMFDMGADGYPELFVKTSDPSWNGSFHVYDYRSGKVRYLGVCYLSSGWLYGTSGGVLYCSGGRQGGYYVDRVVKSSGKAAKKTVFTSIAKSMNDWDAALNRMRRWLKAKGAKALATKRITDFSLLNSKVKCTYKMSEAKVSVTASKSYTGKAVKPKVTVKLVGVTLKAGTGYTVSYRNSKGKAVAAPKAAGTYKVIVKGKGNLKGSVTKTFKVVKTVAAKLITLNVGKTYKSYDVTGDGKVDRVVIQGASPSAPVGTGYYARLVVYVNGKKCLTSPEYSDSRGFYPQVKLIRFKGGKSLLYIHYSTSNGYYAGGWVYRCSSTKGTCLLKTESLVAAYNKTHPLAWRCYESLASVKGSTVSFNVGSFTAAATTYAYRYSGGKLTRIQ